MFGVKVTGSNASPNYPKALCSKRPVTLHSLLITYAANPSLSYSIRYVFYSNRIWYQSPGCGFPIAKIGVLFSLATGAVIAVVIDVLKLQTDTAL